MFAESDEQLDFIAKAYRPSSSTSRRHHALKVRVHVPRHLKHYKFGGKKTLDAPRISPDFGR
jgi:hypothetical protein